MELANAAQSKSIVLAAVAECNVQALNLEIKRMKKYYILSLKNPKTLKLYNRFKKWKGIPLNEPCSDREREEFERYVLGDERYQRLKMKEEQGK